MDKIIFVQEEPRINSQLVEIPVTTAGRSRVPVPDVQQLRSNDKSRIITKAIRLITVDVLSFLPIDGSPNAPLAELQKISLTLYCEGWEKGYLIPLISLNDIPLTIPGAALPSRFDNWENIDWSKSYLQYANGTSSAGTPYGVILDVQYVRLNAAGEIIIGAAS